MPSYVIPKQEILDALNSTNTNVEAAKKLNVTPNYLSILIRQYQIKRSFK
jgi:hypothetical protein